MSRDATDSPVAMRITTNFMSDDQRQFLLLLRQPPARFTAEQTAWALNFQPYEIQTLVTVRLLKPIGSPAPNATKHFHAKEILELAGDKTWLTKATNALYQHRFKKNSRQKSCQNGLVVPLNAGANR